MGKFLAGSVSGDGEVGVDCELFEQAALQQWKLVCPRAGCWLETSREAVQPRQDRVLVHLSAFRIIEKCRTEPGRERLVVSSESRRTRGQHAELLTQTSDENVTDFKSREA